MIHADKDMSAHFFTEADRFAGAQLRKIRRARGFSQVALADALGVSFQQIQKYERGQNRLSVGKIHSITQFFNISPLYFFSVPDDEIELIRQFVKCHPERRKIILALAQTYANEEGAGN